VSSQVGLGALQPSLTRCGTRNSQVGNGIRGATTRRLEKACPLAEPTRERTNNDAVAPSLAACPQAKKRRDTRSHSRRRREEPSRHQTHNAVLPRMVGGLV
jgi:hypothetical protein